MVKCLSCGGVYEPILPDGVQYFHACPPLSHDELAAAVTAGTVTIGAKETVDDAFARKAWERPDKRNENVKPVTAVNQKALPIAVGKGTQAV